MSLIATAERFRSDKGTAHRYWELYDTLLRRHLDARTVLELGVLRGESLRVWHAWFPHADIHGIDPAPEAVPQLDRVTVHQIDAYSTAALAWGEAAGPFDVIIDDGPHTIESQVFAAANWSRLLAPAGTFVVEDIPDPDLALEIVEALPDRLRRYASIIDRRHVPGVAGYGDDILVVVDKAAEL